MQHRHILVFLLCCIFFFSISGLSFAQNSSASGFLKETFDINEQEMAAYLKQIAVKDPQKYASLMEIKAGNEELFEVRLLQEMTQGQTGLERLDKSCHSKTQKFLAYLSTKDPQAYKLITKIQEKSPRQANLLIMQKMISERSKALLSPIGHQKINLKLPHLNTEQGSSSHYRKPPAGIIKINMRDDRK